MDEQDIAAALAAMVLALDESHEAVYRLHCLVVQDESLYLACWSRLDARFRRTWVGALDDHRYGIDRESGRIS